MKEGGKRSGPPTPPAAQSGPRLSSKLSAGMFSRVQGPGPECLGQGQTLRKEGCDLPEGTRHCPQTGVWVVVVGGEELMTLDVPAPAQLRLNLPLTLVFSHGGSRLGQNTGLGSICPFGPVYFSGDPPVRLWGPGGPEAEPRRARLQISVNQ